MSTWSLAGGVNAARAGVAANPQQTIVARARMRARGVGERLRGALFINISSIKILSHELCNTGMKSYRVATPNPASKIPGSCYTGCGMTDDRCPSASRGRGKSEHHKAACRIKHAGVRGESLGRRKVSQKTDRLRASEGKGETAG